MMNHDLQVRLTKELAAGLQKLALFLSAQQQESLINLLFLLKKWNSVFNLTAIKTWDKMVSHHLLDSLSIAPYLRGEQILDFGSGAGFPGLPLACYYPEKKFVLVESVSKKAHFISQAISELRLKNVVVLAERIEKISLDSIQFDCIISRAVCTLSKFVALTQPFSNHQTIWLAMKGELCQEELAELKNAYDVVNLNVPGIETKRKIVIISRVC